MEHYDDETLALLALGEGASAVTTDTGRHLLSCPTCRSEVDTLSAVVATGRALTANDIPARPPERVWDHIVAELELPTDAQSGAALNAVPQSRTREATRPTKPIPGLWPRPVLLAVAAAIIGVLVGTGATLALTRSSTPPTASPTSTPILVQTALQPLDTPTAHGTAVLSVGTDQRSLTVHIVGLPEVPDGFYEVWLMNAAPQRLLSLGVLNASASGVFAIPAGLDLSKYPVVDVSLQPFNGSPEHSGTSAVRGSFKA